MCLFLLSSRLRLSSVSVVFDFNNSLNDVTPVYPMLQAVYDKRKEKIGLLMEIFCVSSFFCLHCSDRVE